MLTNVDRKNPKSPIFFECLVCDYNTSYKKDYNKHLLTQKHKKRINVDQMLTDVDQKNPKNPNTLICSCGKKYLYKQSLSIHKKKCISQTTDIIDINEPSDEMLDSKVVYEKIINDLVNTVQEQNKIIQEQHNTMKEMIPKIGNTNNGNINIVKIDNITLLNDKCKDALSINEFIESIEININDLMYTSKKGLPSGLSQILVERLNNLPLVKRPIWCSDKKRKKLFIKENEWSEDTNREKTKEAIKNLSVKQTKNINKYTKENPDWMQNDKKKDTYLSIVKNVTDPIVDKSDKIIYNLIETIHLSQEKNKLITESI